MMSERIARNLRRDVFRAIVRNDVGYFDETKVGDLLSRLNSDVTVIQDGLSTNISVMVRTFGFALGVIIMLFVISWQLTLTTIGVLLPVVVITQIYGKRERKLSKQQQDNKAECATVAEESFGNVRIVKSFATERYEH